MSVLKIRKREDVIKNTQNNLSDCACCAVEMLLDIRDLLSLYVTSVLPQTSQEREEMVDRKRKELELREKQIASMEKMTELAEKQLDDGEDWKE